MATYITKAGDTVDFITWKHYGYTNKLAVEQVLDANPGLADRGPILPHSVRIELPDLKQQAIQKRPRLWD